MPSLKELAEATGLPRKRRWKDAYAEIRALLGQGLEPPPPTRKVDPEIEALAQFMVRGFHDWYLQGQHYLEPGFRHLVGQAERVIYVHYTGLRDDREHLAREAFDAWQETGFTFVDTESITQADIIIDDEDLGAVTYRRFEFTGRMHPKLGIPIMHSSARSINIASRWPKWQLKDTLMHEIGHALGLGHPGRYNGGNPPQVNPADNVGNTIMSYFGGLSGKLGEADRVAIELIYGASN